MNLGEILFPTDFSARSEAAGRIAAEMARQWGARLHVVHVVPPVTDPGDASERLTRAAAALGEDLRIEAALLSGRIGRTIVQYARGREIGLIVLGTHGRTGVSRVLLGSVAETVVRLAPCLVLSVPAHVLEPPAGEAPDADAPAILACIVCAAAADELVCETCRARIRGEALERKLMAERPGHRGPP